MHGIIGILRVSLLFKCLTLLLPSSVSTLPPTPSQGAPSCDVSVRDSCYVKGPFDITTASAGAHHYQVCRSTEGSSGCDETIATHTQMPYRVDSLNVPNDGQRWAYRFRACTSEDACTPWSASPPAHVATDLTAPSKPGPAQIESCAVGATGPEGCWVSGDFTIAVTPATDEGSGIAGYRVCRSHDSIEGFAGCHVDMSSESSHSLNVSGQDLPTEGHRRAYRFRARDQVGLEGLWSEPIYVRVDSRDPWVSATKLAHSTVAVTAGDDHGGFDANSGLETLRHRWDTPLSDSCTDGSALPSGDVIDIPGGTHTLYLCARDFTGRISHWQGTFQAPIELAQRSDMTFHTGPKQNDFLGNPTPI